MSTEENKKLVRRFYEEVWDQGNTDFAFEVFADDLGLLQRLGAPVYAGAAPEAEPRLRALVSAA